MPCASCSQVSAPRAPSLLEQSSHPPSRDPCGAQLQCLPWRGAHGGRGHGEDRLVHCALSASEWPTFPEKAHPGWSPTAASLLLWEPFPSRCSSPPQASLGLPLWAHQGSIPALSSQTTRHWDEFVISLWPRAVSFSSEAASCSSLVPQPPAQPCPGRTPAHGQERLAGLHPVVHQPLWSKVWWGKKLESTT